ncbi:MAG TPA: hypothetical protein V6C58_26625 [Allocoleopsis sp.]
MGYLGYKLNENGKEPRIRKNIRKEISINELPSSENIYNSDYLRKMKQEELKAYSKNFEASKNPCKSGIVSPAFGLKCKFDKISKSPMFRNRDFSLEKQDFTVADANLDRIYSGNVSELTGEQLSQEESFLNENARPMFGSRVRQNTNPEQTSTILERFTGVSKLDIPNNTEGLVQAHRQNTFGNKILTDNISPEYFIPTIFKNGERPTPKILVKPFNPDNLRPQIKDIDQLRVKPKTTISISPIKGQGSDVRISKLGVRTKIPRPKINDAPVLSMNNTEYYPVNKRISPEKSKKKATEYRYNTVKGIEGTVKPLYSLPEQNRNSTNFSRISNVYDPSKGESNYLRVKAKDTHRQNTLYSRTGNADSRGTQNYAKIVDFDTMRIPNKFSLVETSPREQYSQKETINIGVGDVNIPKEESLDFTYVSSVDAGKYGTYNGLGESSSFTSRSDHLIIKDPDTFVLEPLKSNPYSIRLV